MNRKLFFASSLLVLVFGGSALFLVLGCAEQSPQATNAENSPLTPGPESTPANLAGSMDPAPPAKEGEEEHGHIPGAHGGFIVPIGRDSYHAEVIFGPDGLLSLYMLAADESRVHEVENQNLTGYAKSSGSIEATSFELKPSPQSGDTAGMTSRFAGTMPTALWGQPVEVTIPVIRIGQDRFRLGFNSDSQPHADTAMPAKVTSQQEKDLYLTTGGIYTDADIQANGNQTASQKFAGVMAAHDLSPKSGEKICPITLTKSNPNFTWVVGGKQYEFCCPPCVDEFVEMAKTEPEKIKQPDDYVKQ